MIVFSLLLMAAAPTEEDAAVLTGLIATAATQVQGVDVITRADVRAAVAAEGDRQSMGCIEESCLAEIAAALDARAVMFGTLGVLGDGVVLQLNLFDSKRGISAGRASLRGKNASSIADDAERSARDLMERFVKNSGNARVLVLDLELHSASAGAASAGAATPNDGIAPLTMVGGVVAGIGVLGVGAGVLFDALSLSAVPDSTVSAGAAKDAYATSDAYAAGAIVGYLAGGALLVGGVVVATLGFMGE